MPKTTGQRIELPIIHDRPSIGSRRIELCWLPTFVQIGGSILQSGCAHPTIPLRDHRQLLRNIEEDTEGDQFTAPRFSTQTCYLSAAIASISINASGRPSPATFIPVMAVGWSPQTSRAA